MTYRPRPISGFPEHPPAVRLAELAILDSLRARFEAWGYGNIETPAVEELDVLLAKGETDKEIYTLTRLQADADSAKDARLGLHFDLTVPFARYVAQHFNDLSFPFKRHQVQKVWRGERPQEGRFREFYQADIDVVAVDALPLHYDAEAPLVALEALAAIGVADIRLALSNRKILQGYLTALDIAAPVPVIRILDKLDKIGADGVASALVSEAGLRDEIARKCLALAAISGEAAHVIAAVEALGVSDALLTTGLEELRFVMDRLAGRDVIADLSIARGFDYYTGTVYEGRLIGDPGFGAVVSGGRYDDLAGAYINRKLPGVGISIGVSRLFAKLQAEGRVDTSRASPTDILVILPGEERRDEAEQTAATLRARGFRVECWHSAQKLKRPLSYAEKKGIAYVWFPPFEPGGAHEVKIMASGEQGPADPESWQP